MKFPGGNQADVTASGTVDIDQNGSDHAIAEGAGNITINQLADVNDAFVINNAGTTYVEQKTGSNNAVWLDRNDVGIGDVNIVQDGASNKVYGLTGTLTSPTWAIFTGTHLDVDQIGSQDLLQLNANGSVTVGQNGTLNTAYVSQQ